MAVDLMKAAVSVGVGLLDEGMEIWDERQGRSESFQNATDIQRVVGAVVGYGGQLVVRDARLLNLLEPATYSYTSLLTKSVFRAFRTGTRTTTAPAAVTERSFQARRRISANDRDVIRF